MMSLINDAVLMSFEFHFPCRLVIGIFVICLCLLIELRDNRIISVLDNAMLYEQKSGIYPKAAVYISSDQDSTLILINQLD